MKDAHLLNNRDTVKNGRVGQRVVEVRVVPHRPQDLLEPRGARLQEARHHHVLLLPLKTRLCCFYSRMAFHVKRMPCMLFLPGGCLILNVFLAAMPYILAGNSGIHFYIK